MKRSAPHIVCFAPYTDWSIHSARQVTILNALRRRGCSVSYITCDGVFSDCDLYQQATAGPGHRPADACSFCQARVATKLAGWGMPFRWLSRWLTSEDRAAASKWVQSLKPLAYPGARYPDARHGSWPIGDWVKSSVHRHFRHNTLDLTDPRVAAVYGSYLFSGALAAMGLDRLFAEETPDAQLLFNGRMGVTRVALELAKPRGIRTICEERGYVAGRITLFDNVNCLDFTSLGELWADWRDVPLTAEETHEIGQVLTDRWHGRSKDVSAYSAGLGATANAIAALGLDPARPTWALYPSSLDEASEIDTSNEPFESQYAWIDATVAFVAARPNLQLVIRIHPNAGSRKSLGQNDQDLAYFEALATRLPANVRLVPSASTFGSYDLARAAALGLIWRSTIGLEMAAMGATVVRVGAGPLCHAHFMQSPATPAGYHDILLEHASRKPGHDIATAIQAWRFAHTFFFRWSMPFPLVRQPKWYVGEMNYTDATALAPGKDATLDHICRVFMERRPLFNPAPERSADVAAAEAGAIAARIAPYRSGFAATM
ncbi:MAG: hypothetical protein SFV19_10785 [Rhodospirillaceae bacterium]|nr:hypothetical protein [Rhodospirillaceae bacterium]